MSAINKDRQRLRWIWNMKLLRKVPTPKNIMRANVRLIIDIVVSTKVMASRATGYKRVKMI